MSRNLMMVALATLMFSGCVFDKQVPMQSDEMISQDFSQDTKQNTIHKRIKTKEELEKQSILEGKFAKFDKYLGKNVGVDCSGFVFLVNKELGKPMFKSSDISKNYDKSGQRSKAMYNFFKKQGRTTTENPSVGDLIFFANTYGASMKKNKDRENVTHVGVVTKIFDDGRIEFIHNLGKIVKKGYMDMQNKNVKERGKEDRNSYIIKCRKGLSDCLTSQRFTAYGKTGL